MYNDHIKVWRFQDAPEELKNMSKNGGDEDWVALVPQKFEDEYIPWIESNSFGRCCVNEYVYLVYPGYRVFIGCHS